MKFKEWITEGEKLFGRDPNQWKFICPVCKYVQSVKECRYAGMPITMIGYSCIGRFLSNSRKAFGGDDSPGPCDYAGGGLFVLNPVDVEGQKYFDFYREKNKEEI